MLKVLELAMFIAAFVDPATTPKNFTKGDDDFCDKKQELPRI